MTLWALHSWLKLTCNQVAQLPGKTRAPAVSAKRMSRGFLIPAVCNARRVFAEGDLGYVSSICTLIGGCILLASKSVAKWRELHEGCFLT
eukprot:453360-Pelagomonas_calceolata.AAC.8